MLGTSAPNCRSPPKNPTIQTVPLTGSTIPTPIRTKLSSPGKSTTRWTKTLLKQSANIPLSKRVNRVTTNIPVNLPINRITTNLPAHTVTNNKLGNPVTTNLPVIPINVQAQQQIPAVNPSLMQSQQLPVDLSLTQTVQSQQLSVKNSIKNMNGPQQLTIEMPVIKPANMEKNLRKSTRISPVNIVPTTKRATRLMQQLPNRWRK